MRIKFDGDKITLGFFVCLFIVLFSGYYCNGQSIDTAIRMPAYTSYFNNKMKVPVFVVYKLYKGGGDCSRADDAFKYVRGINTARKADYQESGYDIGHMANSKDFAYDCDLQEQTFRFYNALPQTARLNRGTWRTAEYKIRKMSQDDTLVIACGGFFNTMHTIPNTNVVVPDECWKVVKNLRTGEIVFSKYYTNTDEPQSFPLDASRIAKLRAWGIPY